METPSTLGAPEESFEIARKLLKEASEAIHPTRARASSGEPI